MQQTLLLLLQTVFQIPSLEGGYRTASWQPVDTVGTSTITALDQWQIRSCHCENPSAYVRRSSEGRLIRNTTWVLSPSQYVRLYYGVPHVTSELCTYLAAGWTALSRLYEIGYFCVEATQK
jgi:hypothetical protein